MKDTVARNKHGLRQAEFIAMMSMVTATIALSIDTLLPAFDELEKSFGLSVGESSVSLTVTVFFLSLAIGIMVYGPLADRFGRKPVMYGSLGLFLLGAIISTSASSFGVFLIGRAIWGFGAAGPRTVAIAITRDCYSGDLMARIMSFTAAIFLIVPVLAPALGEGLLVLGDWRLITGTAIALGAAAALWFSRINETLEPENVIPLEPKRFLLGAKAVLTNKQTALYTLAGAMAYGAFFPWLGSSIRMIETIYGREGQFAWFFGLNAILMAAAILATARAVTFFGTYRVALVLSVAVVVTAIVFVVPANSDEGISFWVFFALAALLTSLNSSSTALFQTLSMEPMGDLAGTAASITGFLIFAPGAILGALVDRAIDTDVLPFGLAFLIYGSVGLAAVILARPSTVTT